MYMSVYKYDVYIVYIKICVCIDAAIMFMNYLSSSAGVLHHMQFYRHFMQIGRRRAGLRMMMIIKSFSLVIPLSNLIYLVSQLTTGK